MSNLSSKITFVLLCSMAFVMLACKRSTTNEVSTKQQTELKEHRDEKRDIASLLRLGHMLNARDFERALPYLDSLHRVYPNDPQFSYIEGWIYDMQGDSLLARTAYTKSLAIYDSIIAAEPNFNDMINRAFIIQDLYGMEAYTRALDEIQSKCSPKDSLEIEQMWRNTVLEKDKLSFLEFSISNN